MAKQPALLDQVRDRLPKKGQSRWVTKLDPPLRAELEEIKASFESGQMGSAVTKTGLANAISAALLDRGVAIGPYGVLCWLQNHR
jgi:hypothetical protein